MTIGLGRVTHALIGAEVIHKPSGRFGTVAKVAPPDGVYVDFGGQTQYLDAEELRQ